MYKLQQKIQKFTKQFSFFENCMTSSHVLDSKFKQRVKPLNLSELDFSNLLTFKEAVVNYKKTIKKYEKIQVKSKTNWKKQQIEIMFFIILCNIFQDKIQLDNIQPQLWLQISYYLYIRTPQECKFKWMSRNINALSQTPLDAVEDVLFKNILKKLNFENINPKWSKVVYEFNKQSPYSNKCYRSTKTLKKHWIMNICNIEKGVWKLQEDLLLFQGVEQYGKKWSKISKLMKNARTQYAVKNRYFTVMQKEIKKKSKFIKSQQDQFRLVSKILNKIRLKLNMPDYNQEETSDDKLANSVEQSRQHENGQEIVDQNTKSNQQLFLNQPSNPLSNPSLYMPTYFYSYYPNYTNYPMMMCPFPVQYSNMQ